MPAQPIGRKRKGITHLQFAGQATQHRPLLAPKVLQVLEIWSVIEGLVVNMAGHFMKSDPELTIEVFNAIESQTTRWAAVGAAARASLSQDNFTLFDDTSNSVAEQRKIRNSFAHHIWGISPQLPEALLLVDPKDVARHLAQVQGWSQALRDGQVIRTPAGLDRSRVFIWTATDLDEAVIQAQSGLNRVLLLSELVRQGFAGPACDSMRTQLLNEPAIQAKAESRSKRSDHQAQQPKLP